MNNIINIGIPADDEKQKDFALHALHSALVELNRVLMVQGADVFTEYDVDLIEQDKQVLEKIFEITRGK